MSLAACQLAASLALGLMVAAPAAGQTANPSTIGNSRSGALPAMGDNSELSAAQERRIGDRIAAGIYRDPDNIDDPVLGDYVQSLWLPLQVAARTRGELQAELDERFAWELFLIRDRSINAFALPGGYFGVHLGLISAVGSPDEMAAVLAHELSHVTQRHISRLMTQQNRQAPWLLAAMVLGALAASKYPDAGAAAMAGGQALAVQGQLNFSRDMEREADRVGFGVMSDAGFESAGMTSMFQRLQQASRLNDNGSFPYLRSHPLTTQRIGEAQARVQLAAGAATAPTAQKLTREGQALMLHAMMAARARVLTQPGVDALSVMVAEARRRAANLAPPMSPASKANVADAGALYGGVLAAAHLRDFAAARSLMSQLMPLNAQVDATREVIDLLGLELELLEGRVPAAATAEGPWPLTGSRAQVMFRARALMAAKRGQDVPQGLRTWVTDHPKDAAAWQLLATALDQQNKPVQAIRAEAESRAAQMDYSGALDRLKAAQTLMRNQPGSADYVEGSILDTRTRQIESLLREQMLQDKVNR